MRSQEGGHPAWWTKLPFQPHPGSAKRHTVTTGPGILSVSAGWRCLIGYKGQLSWGLARERSMRVRSRNTATPVPAPRQTEQSRQGGLMHLCLYLPTWGACSTPLDTQPATHKETLVQPSSQMTLRCVDHVALMGGYGIYYCCQQRGVKGKEIPP